MPPNSGSLRDSDNVASNTDSTSTIGQYEKRTERKIFWMNVIYMCVLHLFAIYGVLLLPSAKPWTWLWIVFCHYVAGIGVTAGAHRLWSHRSYKATWLLRVLLMLMNNVAAQNSIFEWARDHRVHHKYAETDADPHNAKRGFFFSHIGWLLVRKHPAVITKGQQLDLKDLYQDPIVMFQKRHYVLLSTLFNIILPIVIPFFLWNEPLFNGFFIAFALRYTIILNATWCVNSLAHLWGSKPYDKNINPAQNYAVVLGAVGEGYHNFHHVFPQDYATSELGSKMNVTKWFLDACAWLGLAYDLKTVSPEAIKKRRIRTGDLQHLQTDHHD